MDELQELFLSLTASQWTWLAGLACTWVVCYFWIYHALLKDRAPEVSQEPPVVQPEPAPQPEPLPEPITTWTPADKYANAEDLMANLKVNGYKGSALVAGLKVYDNGEGSVLSYVQTEDGALVKVTPLSTS